MKPMLNMFKQLKAIIFAIENSQENWIYTHIWACNVTQIQPEAGSGLSSFCARDLFVNVGMKERCQFSSCTEQSKHVEQKK